MPPIDTIIFLDFFIIMVVKLDWLVILNLVILFGGFRPDFLVEDFKGGTHDVYVESSTSIFCHIRHLYILLETGQKLIIT
jgi:hypothetical protein